MWMPGPADLREVSLGDMSVGYILDEMYESESRGMRRKTRSKCGVARWDHRYGRQSRGKFNSESNGTGACDTPRDNDTY